MDNFFKCFDPRVIQFPMPRYCIKVILVGTNGVGKTSLVNSFQENPFEAQVLPTVCPAYSPATLTIGDSIVELQIWDTAGQERYQAISQMFYQGARIAFVCFDSASLTSVHDWTDKIRAVTPDCVIFFVITKADLLDPAATSKLLGDATTLKDELGVRAVVVTSSFSGFGVRDLFEAAAKCHTEFYRADVNQQPLEPLDEEPTTCCK
jgi:small GTP-binding protein